MDLLLDLRYHCYHCRHRRRCCCYTARQHEQERLETLTSVKSFRGESIR